MSSESKVAEAPLRLDAAVAQLFGLSRNKARQAIVQGLVRLNGKRVQILARQVRVNDRLTLSDESAPTPRPAPGALVLLYEDDDFVVINKPPALLSERREGEAGESVLDRLKETGFLVHRLDAGTSGVMLVARTPAGADRLSRHFLEKRIEKTYLLLCLGDPTRGAFTGALGRDPKHPRRFAVLPNGKDANTRYVTVAAHGATSVALARPVTGRTHQIRVHFATAKHPLLGDALYGGPRRLPRTQAPDAPKSEATQLLFFRPLLHAWRLRFAHPFRPAEEVVVEAPVPEDFILATAGLGHDPQILTHLGSFATF